MRAMSAQAARLGLDADVEGSAIAIIAAADTVMTRPERGPHGRGLPDGAAAAARRRAASTLLAIDQARRLLGYEPAIPLGGSHRGRDAARPVTRPLPSACRRGIVGKLAHRSRRPEAPSRRGRPIGGPQRPGLDLACHVRLRRGGCEAPDAPHRRPAWRAPRICPVSDRAADDRRAPMSRSCCCGASGGGRSANRRRRPSSGRSTSRRPPRAGRGSRGGPAPRGT